MRRSFYYLWIIVIFGYTYQVWAKATTTITCYDKEGCYNQEIELKAKLQWIDENGKAHNLSGKVIKFYIDNIYKGEDKTNWPWGNAVINYTIDVEEGEHTIKAVFEGDDEYEASEGTAKLTVKRKETAITLKLEPSEVSVGQLVKISGKLKWVKSGLDKALPTSV
jgi:hypothetical protein